MLSKIFGGGMQLLDMFNMLSGRLLEWQKTYSEANGLVFSARRLLDVAQKDVCETLVTALRDIVPDMAACAVLDHAFADAGLSDLPSALYARSEPQRAAVRGLEAALLAYYKDETSVADLYKRQARKREHLDTLARYRAKQAAASAQTVSDSGQLGSPTGLLNGANRLYEREIAETEKLEASLALYEQEQAKCITPEMFAKSLARVMLLFLDKDGFADGVAAALPEPIQPVFLTQVRRMNELGALVTQMGDTAADINAATNAARPVEDFLRARLTIYKDAPDTPAFDVLGSERMDKVMALAFKDKQPALGLIRDAQSRVLALA